MFIVHKKITVKGSSPLGGKLGILKIWDTSCLCITSGPWSCHVRFVSCQILVMSDSCHVRFVSCDICVTSDLCHVSFLSCQFFVMSVFCHVNIYVSLAVVQNIFLIINKNLYKFKFFCLRIFKTFSLGSIYNTLFSYCFKNGP